MGVYTIRYPARCKHCHFHEKAYQGKKSITKCMYGYEKEEFKGHVHTIRRYTETQLKEAPQTTLRTKACKNFIMWGTDEKRVNQQLK